MSNEPDQPDDDDDEFPGFAQLESIMPSIGWVVHEVARATETAPLIWAWCKVGVDAPGYTEITFTRPDGQTPIDPGGGTLVLGHVITKLWC